jgi:protein-L-isoaspartate(D-aspartate) O-methyltransferase
MVIPVGDRKGQTLTRIRRRSHGFFREDLMECNFVSLVGEHGWAKKEKVSGQ